jgi:hypothetical protein
MSASNQAVLDYLSSSSNLSDADIYSFMQANGVPASQIANVTGIPLADVVSRVSDVAPASNMLGGVILAGDSWLSGEGNTAIANEAFGQNVSNVAVGGSTTQDALNQLNSFISKGGNFQNGSTIVLDIGGNDLLQGVSKDTVKNNLNELVSKLGNEGVKVILSGAPNVGSISDVTSSTKLAMDSLYGDIAKNNKNVTVVDAMSGLLNQKSLVDATGFHLNTAGQTSFIDQLASAYNPQTTSPAAAAQLNLTTQTTPTTASSSTVKDYQGNSFDSNAILALARQLAPTMDSKNLAGGVYSTQGESIGFDYAEATKLLGHAPSAAEQVVLDMARQLNQTGITDLSQVQAGDTSTRFGSTFTGGGGTIYEIQKDPTTGAITTSTWGKNTSDKGNIVAALSIGAGLLGIPTSLGASILGAGYSNLAAATLGGGLFSGAAAGLTGGNILKGALLGAAGGAAGEYFRNPTTGEITPVQTPGSTPFTGADYSLANGVGPQGLDSMGGAQGLQPGTSANLDSMGGAQGFTFNAGAPVTTVADLVKAINTMNGSYNPANLDSMGGGQGLTYQTPSGLVTQGGTLLTGGSTGNNNVIGETGVNTAYNIGNGIGDTLAKVDTGVYDPTKGMLSSAVTGFNADGSLATTLNGSSSTAITDALSKLTPAQIASITAGLLGGKAVASAVTTPKTTVPAGIPTQGVPLNTQDYYNAIQQNYNKLLPAVPRDVASPLRAWYNSAYGA